MIKITPADIIQQQFRVVFRGFDMSEVDSFLSQVADELEELLSENASLKNELKKKEQQSQGHDHCSSRGGVEA